MQKVLLSIFIFVILTFFSQSCIPEKSTPTLPQVPPKEQKVDSLITDWLKQNAVSLNTYEPNTGFDDFSSISSKFDRVDIVALGQAAWGIHEFALMKHRFLEFLLAKKNFKAVALDAPWGECSLLNDYIQTGTGNLPTLVANLNTWWLNTQEMLDMIEWLKDFNQSRSSGSKVKLYGIDMTSPQMPMEHVINYLQGINPDQAVWSDSLVDCFRSYLSRLTEYQDEDSTVKAQCSQNLQTLYDTLSSWQDTLIAQTSEGAYDLALQNARLVVQAEDVFSRGLHGSGFRKRQDFLAENVLWILNYPENPKKTVVLSDNISVAVSPKQIKTMGTHLKILRGDRAVKLLGCSFYQGSFYQMEADTSNRITVVEAPEVTFESYENYVHTANKPLTFLYLADIQSGVSVRTNWLFSLSLRNFNTFYDARLASEYDGFFFFENVSPAFLLFSN